MDAETRFKGRRRSLEGNAMHRNKRPMCAARLERLETVLAAHRFAMESVRHGGFTDLAMEAWDACNAVYAEVDRIGLTTHYLTH